MHSRTLLACYSLVLSLGMGVLAQQEMAACEPGWEWNQNSLGQDPCTVGSKLDAACRGIIEYNYDKLISKDDYYVAPSKNHTGDMQCDCNTVIYSLIAACSTCQEGRPWVWSGWALACDSVYIAQYPGDIPDGTAVPRWAFYDVTLSVNGSYTDATAQAIGRDPEELPKQVVTTSQRPDPTATGSIGTPSKHNNTGAIIGGAVGGAAALVVSGLIIFYVVLRGRKSQDADPNLQSQFQGPPANSWKPTLTSPTAPMYNQSVSSGPTVAQHPQFQPYDPANPSTFPPQVTYARPISDYSGVGR